MNPTDILGRCEKLGVQLQLEDGRLFAEPADKIPPRLAGQISEHREELIEAVRPPLDRTAKYKQALKWLNVKAIELQITTNDPAHDFMVEALDGKYNHLNDAWCDAGDEDFLQALREYAAAGVRELRV